MALLTPKEACARLGVSRKVLNRMARARLFPVIRYNSRIYRFRDSDLDEFIRRHERKSAN
jgi:excisionase family DNA binding protein